MTDLPTEDTPVASPTITCPDCNNPVREAGQSCLPCIIKAEIKAMDVTDWAQERDMDVRSFSINQRDDAPAYHALLLMEAQDPAGAADARGDWKVFYAFTDGVKGEHGITQFWRREDAEAHFLTTKTAIEMKSMTHEV